MASFEIATATETRRSVPGAAVDTETSRPSS
jgi:hypothetical protein